jgi:hypothetical protein
MGWMMAKTTTVAGRKGKGVRPDPIDECPQLFKRLSGT